MEKFMFIFQGGMPTDASPEQMQANMGKWMGWIDKLSKDGKYVAGEPLLPGGKLIKGKNKSVTDGPYTEGKELVGGFFIVNAADLFMVWQCVRLYREMEVKAARRVMFSSYIYLPVVLFALLGDKL
jgi:hypothetical protein